MRKDEEIRKTKKNKNNKMEGKARFDAAVQFLAENKNKLSFDQAQQLSLYGLFKQANQGPCNMSKPSIFNFADRAKWFPPSSFAFDPSATQCNKVIKLKSVTLPLAAPAGQRGMTWVK
jgi:acyl-CoA-binding protein